VIPDLIADGLPPNEYDTYAPHIVGLLARGATVEEVTDHLEHCRTRAMGLRRDRAADRKLAEMLVSLWRERRLLESRR
jgi:hypothetical protein